ncbi:MAG TPA: ribonuclease H-like domain-containing protein [Candidatus Limnocylindrales bacterium]
MIDGGDTTLARRLERYRLAAQTLVARDDPPPVSTPSAVLAEHLAAATDGEVLATHEGIVVRCEVPARSIPVDRERLARLPGQPPADAPLVCLDTETTGLATAAGTVAFLIGLGWWEGDRFRQVRLLLPDHAHERALLTALAATIVPAAWLVTYNGRGFDWPLLVARYRLARRAAPAHAGHLDLLPIVRRLFRHRMDDARLRTAEAQLLGLHRIGDVDGSEIPGRYLRFLRTGMPDELVEVVRHNDQDVRSLARLLGHLEVQLGNPDRRAGVPAGDLAGLARAFTSEHRLGEALACLDDAVARADPIAPTSDVGIAPNPARHGEEAWWSPKTPADFGGRPRPRLEGLGPPRTAAFHVPWSQERLAIDRAHLLRRLGRYAEAAEAWASLAAGVGRTAIVASIELAKVQEHRLRDPVGATRTTMRGLAIVDRRRQLGRPEPALEADLYRRLRRLRRRAAAGGQRSVA